MLARAFPHVSCMIHELVAHLHLCILQPQLNVLEVYVNRALKYATSPLNLSYRCFPFSILDPIAQMMSLSADGLFEVPSHPVLVVLELVLILDPVFWCLIAIAIHAVGLRLSQELLGSDLDLCRRIVLDLSHTHGPKVLCRE